MHQNSSSQEKEHGPSEVHGKSIDIGRPADTASLDSISTPQSDEIDKSNPINWSRRYKWLIVGLLSTMTLLTNLGTVMCAPAAPSITKSLHASQTSFTSFLVSIWELGEAVGPLLIAPLSEVLGRSPVYHAANVGFVAFSTLCGFAKTSEQLLAFRFLNGLSVAAIVLQSSIIGDLFVVEERGFAMSIASYAPLLGPILGPILGGYINQALGWRWPFWITAIAAGVAEVAFVLFFRETYYPKILAREGIAKSPPGNNEMPQSDKTRATIKAIWQFMSRTVFRPFALLTSSLALFSVAIYVAVVYAYTYVLLTTLTTVFETTYHFSAASSGLSFLGLALGLTTGIFLCQLTLDKYVKRAATHSSLTGPQPEHRLPPMIVGGVVMPIGLFMYGWTAQCHAHWIFPIIGTWILGVGVAGTMIPAGSYLVDAFKERAASALAAMISLRCIAGAILPLAGPPLYSRLGLGWGNSVLGFVALAFMPVPLLLLKYGQRVRQRSRQVNV